MEWLSEQPRALVFTTTITRGEILYGIQVLPAGKRRNGLWNAAMQISMSISTARFLASIARQPMTMLR